MDDRQVRAYFEHPEGTFHRRYEALRAFFVEGLSSREVARQFGYKLGAFKTMASRFRAGQREGRHPPFSARSRAAGQRANAGPATSVDRMRPAAPTVANSN